jgi:hypothetical protein
MGERWADFSFCPNTNGAAGGCAESKSVRGKSVVVKKKEIHVRKWRLGASNR